MRLETDLEVIDDVDHASLSRALSALDVDTNTRAILSSGDEIYIQAAYFSNGFVIEKREGNEESHFHAIPSHPPLPNLRQRTKLSWWKRIFYPTHFLTSEYAFKKDEMIHIFATYLDGRESELNLKWSPGYCDR